MDDRARDREILFGLIALRTGLIGRDALQKALSAMGSWSAAASGSLREVLSRSGAMSEADFVLVDPLFRRHLEQHGGDPSASLAALTDAPTILATGSAPDGGPGARIFSGTPAPDATPDDGELTTDYISDSSPRSARRSAPRGAAPAGAAAPPSRYEPLEFHKEGGLGRIDRARDRELGREVALKTIKPNLADHPSARERFVLEAEITGNLEHPGIVPVYGLGSDAEGRPYYAMRFIRGETLREAIERFHREAPGLRQGERSLRLRAFLSQFVTICQAISYAHARGVLHRDLKPGNIMLGPYGETLVVDWGMAKATGRNDPDLGLGVDGAFQPSSGGSLDATKAGSALGTPQYMSPEQASGSLESIDSRSDIYGLGGVLYAILTGAPPIDSGTLKDVLDRVGKGEIRRPRDRDGAVPRPLEAICLKALALKPEGRYRSARELADDVERWMADEPVSAYREPAWERAARWVRRHRTAAAAAAVLLVTSVVGLALDDFRVGQEKARVERAQAEADANFADVRDAVRTILKEIAAADLPAVPEAAEVRLKIALASDTFGNRLKRRRPTDLQARLDLAQIDREVANLFRMLHRLDEAEEPYRRAIALFRGIVAERPQLNPGIDGLAGSLMDFGELCRLQGRAEEATEQFRRVMEVLDARDAPTRLLDTRTIRAVALTNLAGLKLEIGQPDRAIGLADEAAATLGQTPDPAAEALGQKPEQAAETHMDRLLIAMARQSQGEARRAMGEPLSATRKYYDASLRLSSAEALSAPAALGPYSRSALAPNYLYVHAMTYLGLGRAMAADPESRTESEGVLTDAVREFRELRGSQSKIFAYSRGLGDALASRGEARAALGRIDEARDDLRDARDLWTDLAAAFPKSPEVIASRARSLIDLARFERAHGQPDEARRLLDQAARTLPPESRGEPAGYRDQRQRLRELRGKADEAQ